jgi:hypothetical protein
MTLSHTQLRRWYTSFNRRFFGNSLPADMDVFYAPDDDAHGVAVCVSEDDRLIKIDTAHAGTRFARLILLHECNHHYTGDFGHGPRFQAGMVRLAALGAFRRIW